MRKILLLASLFSFLLSRGQNLVSAELLGITDTVAMQAIYPNARYNVSTYKIRYTTENIDGSVTEASGALMIPVLPLCDNFPLVSYNHGTILLREDVPSRDNFESLIPKLIASTGKVSLSPDYLGLGDNPGLHPYLHAESEASATVDMIRACRQFIADSLDISLNGEVFLTGYSQGGHAAMATAKYIQENNLLAEFDVKAVAPASGPYNLSGTQSATLLSGEPYSNPAYVCYLLFSYNRVYGDLFSDYSEILKSPYDSLIPPLFDGSHSISSINALLPSRIYDFVQDSVLANFRNDSSNMKHPLWRALKDNDNYDWDPVFPMKLYYCTLDEQVDFRNSLDAEVAMQSRGANVTAVNMGELNHFDCIFPSLEGAIGFFEDYSAPCERITLIEKEISRLTIFPNPASDEIRFSTIEGAVDFKMYDLSGRLVLNFHLQNEGETLSVRNLEEGIYYLRGKLEEGQFVKKIIIKR